MPQAWQSGPRRAVPKDDRRGPHHLRVHAPLRIQRARSLRIPVPATRPRIRRTIPPAHQRIRVVARSLQRVPLRTGLPVTAVDPISSVRARGSLRASRTRLTLRTRRPGRTRSADGSGLPSPTVGAVLAVRARRAGRARTAVRPVKPVHTITPRDTRRTRHTHTRLTRLTPQPRRPRHRSTSQLLHLPRQRIPILRQPLHPQRQQGEPRQHQHGKRRKLGVLTPMPLHLTRMPRRHVPAPWLVRYRVSSSISTGAINAEKISLRSAARRSAAR